MLGPGASSIGLAGSAGLGFDVTGGIALVYFYHNGNIVLGDLGMGQSETTGINVDEDVYLAHFLTASNI